ncbi:hypothetical protein H634G_08108 [Metarhizium anisopliae BRIP 53293]|uniref:Prolyl 4-hydroxylase alpha subunit domain-containing protein n=1 Tax=Metarhizium anisopliae BRIP 53293 TaxID=1291518 RepID=A0A0D9NVF4_METAN|nr:hypothetical protein H634G_08108 [Metarhizium anisopliae BRIP 53293]KJK85832.1 hypothetical protein H633G_10322 [Metarhizium anisopliae BRIP 53284]
MGYASEEEIQAGEPRFVKYNYNDVAIPEDFLAGPPPEPVKMEHVDFASSSIPEYEGKIAVVLDNVLSEPECQQFMELAKEAVPDWSPALINVGGGLESHIPKYRSGSRKVWDHQGMVDSIFNRCLEAPGFKEVLARPPKLDETSDHVAVNPEHWELAGLNNRLRILRYTQGEYFKAHDDGSYSPPSENGTRYASFYSIHVYLNSSTMQSPPPEGGCVGGATSFYSEDETRSFDIQAMTGRALIFQQSGLRHSGADVTEGVKYSVRTDVMYRYIGP